MIDARVYSALKADIKARLLRQGRPRWKEVQTAYPEISAASFFRAVKEVKVAMKDSLDAYEPDADEAGEEAAPVAGTPDSERDWREAGSPAALLLEFHRQLEDVERLRLFAMDGDGRIVRPTTFAQAVKMRQHALQELAPVVRILYGATSTDEYIKAVRRVIDSVDPDTGKRIRQAINDWRQALFGKLTTNSK